MAPAAISTLHNEWPDSEGPAKMDKFTMITMLLRAVVTLRHRNDDLTLWAFRPTHDSCGSKSEKALDFEINLTVLEAFGALLTPNIGVVAALYHEVPKINDPALDSGTQQYMMPCHIVVMAYPDKKADLNAHVSSSNPHLKFIADGEDLWPIIKESAIDNCDPLGYIAQQKSVSLGSHAKTVCSYLNDFKAIHSNPEGHPAGDNQTGCGRKFFNYLISFCWGRLHRRFTSWVGLGFVYHLEFTWLKLENEDAINEYPRWESFNTAHTGDKSLTDFLKKHRFILPVLNALLVRAGSFKIGTFDSLIRPVEEGQPSLFTKDTAADFHKLVFGGFIMLTMELGEFQARYRNWMHLDAKARKTALLCFRRIGLYTRLLLNILASTSFRHYITFMVQHGVKSLVPLFEDRGLYDAKWKLRQVALAGESSLADLAKGGITNEADLSDEESEADLQAPRPTEYDVEVVLRWIRGFLLEFIGKRHLEQKSTKMHAYFPKSSIEVAVMIADRVHYSTPGWREFKSLIGDALKIHPDLPANYNTDFVVARLGEEFAKNRKGYRRSIFYIDHFRKLIDHESRGSSQGKLSVPLIVHCEAALVALSEPFKEPKDASMKLHSSMISISRPCCPACWELIALLRGTRLAKATEVSPKLALCGSHWNIYPTVLPPWISDEIRDKMNLKFLSYLSAELVQLMITLDTEQAVARFAKANILTEAVGRGRIVHHQRRSGDNEGEFEEDYYSDKPGWIKGVFADWKTGSDLGRRLRQ